MAGYKRTRTIVKSDSGETNMIIGQEGTKVPSDETKLTVSEVEKLTGVKSTTLRHYDRVGLLCPERTGEGISNNRKLYGADDLERLQTILTLIEYGFSLDEIRQILDDESIDLYEALAQKLLELRQRANRLRNLILFMKFTDITNATDTDLIEGLACGPTGIDQLADLARSSPLYESTIEHLEEHSDEECADALDDLATIMFDLFTADESSGFEEATRTIKSFATWWNTFVAPMEDLGYLGFWAVFEDHGLIAERIEAAGHAGDAGFVQMHVFFVWMVHLMENLGGSIAEVARLADEDVVAALDDAHELVDEIAYEMIGRETADSIEIEDRADLSFCVADWIAGILADEELSSYLNLEEGLAFGFHDVEKITQLFDVLGSES